MPQIYASIRKVTEAGTTIVVIVLAHHADRAETKAAIAEEQLAGPSHKPLAQAPLLGGANVLVARIARYIRQVLTHGLSVDPTLLMPRHRPVLLVPNVKKPIKWHVRIHLVVLAVLIVLVLHEQVLISVPAVRTKTVLQMSLIL